MTLTPLRDRIVARRPERIVRPILIEERMSPFLRRLRDKHLVPTDTSQFYNGAVTPPGDRGAA